MPVSGKLSLGPKPPNIPVAGIERFGIKIWGEAVSNPRSEERTIQCNLWDEKEHNMDRGKSLCITGGSISTARAWILHRLHLTSVPSVPLIPYSLELTPPAAHVNICRFTLSALRRSSLTDSCISNCPFLRRPKSCRRMLSCCTFVV
jgi:hypothetical protein